MSQLNKKLIILGVPELSAKMMDVPLSSTKRNTSSVGLFNSDVARHLIACLENPQSVLRALSHCLKTKDKLHEALTADECNTLLKYFNDSADQWANNGECIAILRELPLFMTGKNSYCYSFQKVNQNFLSKVPVKLL